MSVRETKDMGLKLNGEQIELMRTALLEYQREIRDQERYHCAGLSNVGIELCRKRLVLESILFEIDIQERPAGPGGCSRPKVENIRSASRLRVAPSCEPDYAA